jgi:hypothetical protein
VSEHQNKKEGHCPDNQYPDITNTRFSKIVIEENCGSPNVIDLSAEITHGAFQLRMSQQKLNCSAGSGAARAVHSLLSGKITGISHRAMI